MSVVRSAVIGLCLLGPIGCDPPPPDPGRGGVTEYTALLANLEAVRKDVHALRTDIAGLRQEVARLDAPAVPAPVAAPAPSPTAELAVDELQLDDDDPNLGSAEASVVLVEFSDYECPFCARFNQQVLPALIRDYVETGKVQLITRDLPLPFHSNAVEAALAVNCAAEQQAYETMRAEVFANQGALGADLYRRLAEENGLDTAALDVCMQDSTRREEIERDASYAASVGVSGTPSFFIGKRQGERLVDVDALVGAQPYAAFAELIDRKL